MKTFKSLLIAVAVPLVFLFGYMVGIVVSAAYIWERFGGVLKYLGTEADLGAEFTKAGLGAAFEYSVFLAAGTLAIAFAPRLWGSANRYIRRSADAGAAATSTAGASNASGRFE